jgi:hypothetical protein
VVGDAACGCVRRHQMHAVASAPAGAYQAVASVAGVEMQQVEDLCEPQESGDHMDMDQSEAGGNGDGLAPAAPQSLEEEVRLAWEPLKSQNPIPSTER